MATTSGHATVSVSLRRLARRAGFYGSSVAVMLFAVRLLGAPWPEFPPLWPDSFSYLEVATKGPIHPSFWFDERPVLYPLLLWAAGRSATLAVVAQTVLYTGAFLALGVVAWRTLHSRVVAVVTVVAIAAVAMQPRFSLWNTHVLTESLSLAVAVAMIAAWWWFAAHPSRSAVLWAWGSTLAWVLVRDANVMPVVTVVVPAALAAWIWGSLDDRIRGPLVWGALVVLVAAAYVYVAQDVSGRTQYPFHNNVGMRILPDPDLTAWFVGGGMPLDAALRDRTGKDSWADDEAFLESPALEEYREWAGGPGRRRFLLSLALQFREWGGRLYDDLPAILADDFRGYDGYHVRDRLPSRVGPGAPGARTALAWAGGALGVAAFVGVVVARRRARWRNGIVPVVLASASFVTVVLALGVSGPTTRGDLAWWTVAAVAGLAAGVLGRPLSGVAVFAGVALVSAFADVYYSYVGDAFEAPRHLVGPLARLSLMLVICVALGADRLLAARSTTDARATGNG